ncbi:MAG: AAA family ATPase [Candidatus Obscuribacter sp.]|nr:AAA family ATPase [Candidatus Obscuribacter sp.]
MASRGNSKSKLIIVFIDEIDKANVRVDDLLLNAIVNGILPLADNEMVDVSDVVFIIGGNHGSANVVERKAPPGFATCTEEKREDDREQISECQEGAPSSGFLDRLNEIIFFQQAQPRRSAQDHASASG